MLGYFMERFENHWSSPMSQPYNILWFKPQFVIIYAVEVKSYQVKSYQKFTSPFQNLQNVNNFTEIRGIKELSAGGENFWTEWRCVYFSYFA